MRVLVVGGEAAEKAAIEDALRDDYGELFTLSWSGSIDECLTDEQGADVLLLDGRLLCENPAKILADLHAKAEHVQIVVFSDGTSEESCAQLEKCGAEVIRPTELHDHLRASVFCTSRFWFRQEGLLSQLAKFALERTSEGVCAFDADNRILYWNRALERMFGYPSDIAIGRTIFEILPFVYNDRHSLSQAQQGSSAVGSVVSAYIQFRDSQCKFQMVYAPLFERKEQTGVMMLVLEIDGEPKKESEHASTNEQLLILANAMPNLVWLAGPNGERTLFNDKWIQFTGRTAASLVGTGWLQCVHKRDTVRVWNAYTNAVKARQTYHIEYRLQRADGQYRLVFETGTPQFSGHECLGYLGSCNDIASTHLTQPQPEVKRSAPDPSPQTSTLDHAPIGVWKLDHNLTIIKANPAVAAQLNVDPASLVGLPFTSVVPSISPALFSPVLEHGERVHLENSPVRVAVGENSTQLVWNLAAWPLTDDCKQVIGVAISTGEVTERERQAQQRDDFVAALVHDLKTPLIGADRTLEQMISGSLGAIESAQADVLGMLKRSNQQLLVMVQNLIEVYRYEAGQPSLSFEPLNLCELARTCLTELQALAEHKNISLIEKFPAAVVISADRLAIRRVLLNLLDNAIKFTPKGGTVLVTIEEDDSCTTVLVSDSGIGIPAKDQPNLFQRYWQGETGRRYATGTGLGLYLCRQIVTAHKGKVAVQSRENEGTTLSVTLPK